MFDGFDMIEFLDHFKTDEDCKAYLAALASVLLILPSALLLWVNKRFVVRKV